jgi:IS30 family transposase
MKRRPRIYYSASQRALMWEHWRKGETLHQIARLFDRYHSSVHRILAESGGIRPAERHRSRSALTLIEREEISRGIVEGRSTRAIAAALGRAPSTISREIRRNDGPRGYRASQADQAAWEIEAVARRSVNWCRTESWPKSWQANSAWSGRPSRLPAG